MQTSRDRPVYVQRALEAGVIEASSQFPVVLLTGPRQVGKTTMLQQLAGRDRKYVSLDDPTARILANDDPGLFLEQHRPPVLIDEIQYAPRLLPYIKLAVDAARLPGAFWLTGSQQFHLMRAVSETLAGRVAIVNLLGFSARERRGAALDLPPFLPTGDCLQGRARAALPAAGFAAVFADIWQGAFPALVAGPVHDRDLFYSSYLQTYLQRDVKDLAQVGNEGAFLRFLRAAAARTAQLLNLSDLARDADVAVNTAKHWLSILETSFQVVLVAPYHTSLSKRLVKRPKLYFLDTGLCAYLTRWSSPETLEAGAMAGSLFETFVFGEVLKSWWYRNRTPELYYYRDRDGREIDLVLAADARLHPVEVKRAVEPRAEWTRPFAAMRRALPMVGDGAIVCGAARMMPLDREVTVVPVAYV